MPTNARPLAEPIYDGEIRQVYFFNGRVLSAEDMSREQVANKEGRRRIARGVGDGVAYGLEVSLTPGSNRTTDPALTITAGLAINRRGDSLFLADPVNLALKQPPSTNGTAAVSTFDVCGPTSGAGTVYVAGDGLYLLTIGAVEGKEGRAAVSGLGNVDPTCNTKYLVPGVRFRVLELVTLQSADLSAPNLLRNRIAYRCLRSTPSPRERLAADLFGTPLPKYGLVDDLRPAQLKDCEVPLAVVQLTSTAGLVYLDMWSVRRRPTRLPAQGTAAPIPGALVAGDRRRAEGEAMWLQLQEQLWSLRVDGALTGALAAADRFEWLPPAGFLPTAAGQLQWRTFLGPHAPPEVTVVDDGLLRGILARGMRLEPFRVGQAPLAALNVYRTPEMDSFMLYARAEQARIRVFLNPAPAGGTTAAVTATVPGSDVQYKLSRGADQTFSLTDVPPGRYVVAAAVDQYQPAGPFNVDAVGGRIVDHNISLVLLPNGSLVFSVQDPTGKSLADRVTSLTVSGTPGSFTATPDFAKGQWTVSSVPPGTYTVTAVASGYQTSSNVTVTSVRGTVVSQVIVLTATPQAPRQPDLCLNVPTAADARLNSVRLCMVLHLTEFANEFFVTGKYTYAFERKAGGGVTIEGVTFFGSSPAPASSPAGPAAGPAESTAAAPPMAGEQKVTYGTRQADEQLYRRSVSPQYYIDFPDKKAGPILSTEPWLGMDRVANLPANVTKWLADWRAWLDEDLSGAGIAKSNPGIYISRRFVLPSTAAAVPKQPQAYAVFGTVGIPLQITSLAHLTKLPVRLTKERLPGIRPEIIEQLDVIGFRNVDDLVGGWTDMLDFITEQPTDNSRYLVDDARETSITINQHRRYIEGVDDRVEGILVQQGLTDDVALANADPDALGGAVGSKGLAYRMIAQAKQAAPIQSFALQALGLAEGQVEALAQRGITSQGQLVAAAGREAERAVLAGILGYSGLPQERQASLLDELRLAAIGQMTTGSLQATAPGNLAQLPGISGEVAGRLAAAGVLTVADLARADAGQVAEASGLAPAAVENYVASARSTWAGSRDVALLAPVSAELAAALGAQGVQTVADLAGKSAEQIAGAFGGNTLLANTLISSARAGLGLR